MHRAKSITIQEVPVQVAEVMDEDEESTLSKQPKLEVDQPATREQQPATKYPPFSEMLKLSDIKLTVENIKKKLVDRLKEVKIGTLAKLELKAYPNDHCLAQFASKAYKKEYAELTENLPDDWELLTTASGSNDYYGVAYCHPKQQQVVIAHKGTSSGGDMWTDIEGILLNRHTSQMNSAATFAEKIRTVLNEINNDPDNQYDNELKELKINLQLSFTGHSLGGWLAQITTFTVKYLKEVKKRNDGVFLLKNDKPQSVYHAHTVVFDSPGCQKMLLKMEKEFDVRLSGHSISLKNLDITSYLSAPNLVNAYGYHVGMVYRIFPFSLTEEIVEPNQAESTRFKRAIKAVINTIDKASRKVFDLLEKHTVWYTKELHSIEKIKEVFNPNKSNVYKDTEKVVDWPIITKNLEKMLYIFPEEHVTGPEYYPFFDFAKKENYYSPNSEDIDKELGYYPIRYQTQPLNKKSHSISVFTQEELFFLESWLKLKKEGISSESESLIKNLLGDPNDWLNNFSILKNEENEWEKEIHYNFDDKSALDIINYAKQLLRYFPVVFDVMCEQISKLPNFYEGMYTAKSEDYLIDLKSHYNGLYVNDDKFKLKSFLNINKCRVLHLATVSNTKIVAAMVYDILKRIKEDELKTYTDMKCHTFLNLEQLLMLSPLLNIAKIFESTESKIDNLLVIESQSMEKRSEATELLNELINKLKTAPPVKKIIIITLQESGLSQDYQDYINKPDVSLEEQFEEKLFTGIQFSDLMPELQDSLMVNFQGQKLPLRELVNDGNTLNELIQPETLINLITKNELMVIGREPLLLSDLEAAYAKHDETIEQQNLVDALLENSATPTLFMISGFEQEDIDTKIDKLIKELKINDKDIIDTIKRQTALTDTGTNIRIIIVTGQDKESEFKQLCHDNPHKIIYWLHIKNNQFVWQQLYSGEFYFTRHFNHQIVSKERIKNSMISENPADLFVFTGLKESVSPSLEGYNSPLEKEDTQQHTLAVLLGIYEDQKELFKKNIHQRNIILTTLEKEAETEFKRLSQQNKKSVHWLKVEEIDNHQQIVWYRSHGDLSGLRQYIDSDKDRLLPLKEDDFSQVSDKVVIIAGEPGMGKSTTLTRLSQQKFKSASAWVISVTLKDCQQAIKGLSLNNLIDPQKLKGINEVVKFLLTVGSPGSEIHLTENLLRYSLEHSTSRPLFLLFDGFDEIKEESQYLDAKSQNTGNSKTPREKVIQLLQFIKMETRAKFWVTTRKSQKEVLEDSLSVFATEFKEFSTPMQKAFLEYFWKSNLKLKYAQNKLASFDYEPFATALITRADEVMGKTASGFIGIPLQMRMLAAVFQSKFENYCLLSEKPPLESLFKGLDVSNLYQCFIDAKYDLYFKEKIQVDPMAIDILKEAYTKAHEYLALKILFPEQAGPLLEGKLENVESDTLSKIGIIQLVNGNPEFLHRTFAEYFTITLLQHWLNKQWGRHAHYELSVVEFLLAHILLEKDFQAMHLFLNSQLIKHRLTDRTLTQLGKQLGDLWSRKHFYNKQGETALHIASIQGNTAIIDVLIKILNEYPEKIEELVLAHDKKGNTALHWAAQVGPLETVKLLIDKGADVQAANRFDMTPLHSAAIGGHPEIVKFLIEKYAKIDVVYRGTFTPLQLAALGDHPEIVNFLIEKGANVQATNPGNRTVTNGQPRRTSREVNVDESWSRD